MSLLPLTNPPGWSVCSALCILIMLLPEAKAVNLDTTNQHNGGGSQCGEYSNQVVYCKWPENDATGELLQPFTPEMCQLWDRASQLCCDHNNVPSPSTVTVV